MLLRVAVPYKVHLTSMSGNASQSWKDMSEVVANTMCCISGVWLGSWQFVARANIMVRLTIPRQHLIGLGLDGRDYKTKPTFCLTSYTTASNSCTRWQELRNGDKLWSSSSNDCPELSYLLTVLSAISSLCFRVNPTCLSPCRGHQSISLDG
jgi:hypothetical protein